MRLLLKHLTSKFSLFFGPVKKSNRKNLGKAGEALAYRYLKRHGYTIQERNYSTPIGEIDIIAEDADVLVFVEVKMKRSDSYGLPEEAINSKKMHKLTRLAQLYIKNEKLYNRKARFDVVAILDRGRFAKNSIRLIKNAFFVGDETGHF